MSESCADPVPGVRTTKRLETGGWGSLWEIYHDLLALVPPDLTVEECLIGLHWTLVRSRTMGMAMTPQDGPRWVTLPGQMVGMPVRKLAEYVKSWNFFDATIGLAAINSVINTRDQIERISGRPLSEHKQINAFDYFAELVRGQKVAVIGHFPNLENWPEPASCPFWNGGCSREIYRTPPVRIFYPSRILSLSLPPPWRTKPCPAFWNSAARPLPSCWDPALR